MKEGSHKKLKELLRMAPPLLVHQIKIQVDRSPQCSMFNEFIIYLNLLHHYHYQNASIQDRQIQCWKDQMQVSNVDKVIGVTVQHCHLLNL